VPGFVDLTPQRLPFFRGKPALASAFRLAAVCTFRALALLSTRVGLGRLLLRRIIARVAAGVALLRQPVCGASDYQQGQTQFSWHFFHHDFFRNVRRWRFRHRSKCMPDYQISETGSGKVCNTL
jgi:hypothetical protein